MDMTCSCFPPVSFPCSLLLDVAASSEVESRIIGCLASLIQRTGVVKLLSHACSSIGDSVSRANAIMIARRRVKVRSVEANMTGPESGSVSYRYHKRSQTPKGCNAGRGLPAQSAQSSCVEGQAAPPGLRRNCE